MNRIDRLFALVLELQNSGTRRAGDLAARFEISKRTIYRDIQALSETGVPVVAVPGSGYSLMEGYFLSPLSFTADEATMLLLGSDFVAANFDAQYAEASRSAGRKINVVLSERLRTEVAYIRSAITFVVDEHTASRRPESLTSLRRAIIDKRRVKLVYRTRFPQKGNTAENLREIDPYGLICSFGIWYVIAYCHLRHDIRYFRLDRIVDTQVLDHKFERPANFTMKRLDDDEAERKTIIRLLFDSETAQWVREWPSYYASELNDTGEGLIVTLRVRSEEEILHWLLSWGGSVRVLEPESLRERVVSEATKILSKNS